MHICNARTKNHRGTLVSQPANPTDLVPGSVRNSFSNNEVERNWWTCLRSASGLYMCVYTCTFMCTVTVSASDTRSRDLCVEKQRQGCWDSHRIFSELLPAGPENSSQSGVGQTLQHLAPRKTSTPSTLQQCLSLSRIGFSPAKTGIPVWGEKPAGIYSS